MEIKAESDWYVCFHLNLDIEELKEWTYNVMKSKPGSPTVTGEHDTALWWMENTHPKLKKRLEEITELNEEWGTSIWEFADGGPLIKHSDGQGRGTTFIIILEGRFEITSYHEKFPDRALDSFQYGPGDIFVLKNGYRKFHSGRCLDGYRLALAVYTKHETCPFRDHSPNFKEWWGTPQNKIEV